MNENDRDLTDRSATPHRPGGTPVACRFTQLTPVGRAALATLHIDGPQAGALLERFFQPAAGKPVTALAPGRIVFGRWRHETAAEEVVVVRLGGTRFEVHCHGGAAAIAAIRDSLLAAGAVGGRVDQWLARQTRTTIQAEAWRALTRVKTERAAQFLLDQFHGALEQAIESITDDVQLGRLREAGIALDQLLAWHPFGLHLTTPWRVVIAGPPNVGKSSLMNAIVGFERSIVYSEPGTTRDAVQVITAVQGWLVELVDTAGIRPSDDMLETAGIRRSETQISSADLILLVDDLQKSRRIAATDWSIRAECLLVANKCDLIAATDDCLRPGEVAVSSRTGHGLDELCDRLISCLIPRVPSRPAAVPFTTRQGTLLQQARLSCRDGDSTAARLALQTLLGRD